jgi:formamidopyrimidine-DNA glycosylase
VPELPEVETSCRGISPHCLNHKMISIDVRQPKLRWPVDPELGTKLKQQEIKLVRRRGKYIIIETDEGDLMIHLGMSGSLRVVEPSFPLSKHDHIDICLSNGKIIRYNDPRRFGYFVLNTEGEQHKLLVKLGVEPLTDSFDTDYLYTICAKRKSSIKTLIMNSHVVVGVGNIYAQEALFEARINPNRRADRIAKQRIERLVTAIKEILAKAIKAGGTSLKDFTSADGKPGYFQQTLEVYGRAGENCNICKKALKQSVIGQRTTVYCANCQK